MASDFNDVCRFNATSGGAGPFVVASAVAGHLTPTQANASDGKSYHYVATDGLVWEEGTGVWTAISQTLARTTVINNSDETTSRINFVAPPIVDMFPSPLPLEQPPVFDPGTKMPFQQSAAPTGWTKLTTHNDKAMRVVSGAASFGGSNSFSSVMAQTTVGSHALSVAEMPAHPHGNSEGGFMEFNTGNLGSFALAAGPGPFSMDAVPNTATAGNGDAHTHPITLGIQYVDLIICQKD